MDSACSVRREAVVDDADILVGRAADEAKAVGHQRQGIHHALHRHGERAQDGAIVDVEERDGVVWWCNLYTKVIL